MFFTHRSHVLCPSQRRRLVNATEPDEGKKRRFYGRKRNPSGLTRTTTEAVLAEREGFEPSIRFCRILRSEEHTSELQSLMRISYAVFCLKKKKRKHTTTSNT